MASLGVGRPIVSNKMPKDGMVTAARSYFHQPPVAAGLCLATHGLKVLRLSANLFNIISMLDLDLYSLE
jgi:hypothetical protein